METPLAVHPSLYSYKLLSPSPFVQPSRIHASPLLPRSARDPQRATLGMCIKPILLKKNESSRFVSRRQFFQYVTVKISAKSCAPRILRDACIDSCLRSENETRPRISRRYLREQSGCARCGFSVCRKERGSAACSLAFSPPLSLAEHCSGITYRLLIYLCATGLGLSAGETPKAAPGRRKTR